MLITELNDNPCGDDNLLLYYLLMIWCTCQFRPSVYLFEHHPTVVLQINWQIHYSLDDHNHPTPNLHIVIYLLPYHVLDPLVGSLSNVLSQPQSNHPYPRFMPPWLKLHPSHDILHPVMVIAHVVALGNSYGRRLFLYLSCLLFYGFCYYLHQNILIIIKKKWDENNWTRVNEVKCSDLIITPKWEFVSIG